MCSSTDCARLQYTVFTTCILSVLLCRPCHSAVHHAASSEELARSYYTLDLMLEREDIQRCCETEVWCQARIK